MIRLSALQTVGGEIRVWCRTTLPLLVCFRVCISKEIHYLALFWIGWKVLASSGPEFLGFQKERQVERKIENDGSNYSITKESTTKSNNRQFKSAQQKYLQQPQHCSAATSADDRNARSKYLQSQSSRQQKDPFLMFPADVWVQHICSFLHPRDVTTMACVNTMARSWADHPDVWKQLWLRDYGKALLQWQISRHVMDRSLKKSAVIACTTSEGPPTSDNLSLEGRLLEWLGIHANSNTGTRALSTTMCASKRFYFVFGEIYINYLLAGYNTSTEISDSNGSNNSGCFIGLHGHIFDFGAFSQYHPGLVEPILLECGRDATAYFEDIPHSRVARDLARRLCILANPSCIGEAQSSNNNINPNSNSLGYSCGLRLCFSQSDKDLTEVFERSNTRPQPLKRPNYLLPDKTSSHSRRHPTLMNIRDEWDEAIGIEMRHVQEEEQLRLLKNPLAAWRNRSSPPVWRIYYDPFVKVWKKWDAAKR